MEENKGYIGKNLKVIFFDGETHISSKDGVCTHSDELELILNDKHIIPRSRIIRAEITEVQGR